MSDDKNRTFIDCDLQPPPGSGCEVCGGEMARDGDGWACPQCKTWRLPEDEEKRLVHEGMQKDADNRLAGAWQWLRDAQRERASTGKTARAHAASRA
jgi:hypothetical protein